MNIKAVSFLEEIFEEIEKKLDVEPKFDEQKEVSSSSNFKLENDTWIKVDDVVCVYFDLASSTSMLKKHREKTSAKVFDSYIRSTTRIFQKYNCSYLDIQGDGGFAIFSGKNHIQRAMVAAITLKTLLAKNYSGNLHDLIKKKYSKIELSSRIGIHIGEILAKKSGIRGENEILWLGGLVSIASKICGLKRENADELFKSDSQGKIESDMLRISDSLYEKILKLDCSEFLVESCECGVRENLWEALEFENSFYGIERIYILKSKWCKKCGDEFSKSILDNEKRWVE